jgi:LysM repeat protein
MVARHRAARWVAPIALTATVVATYVVVHNGLNLKHQPAHAHVAVHATTLKGPFKKATFYIVQPGDSLSKISVKTGLTVPTLESLNPNVDPNALQTGQRLRLRR